MGGRLLLQLTHNLDIFTTSQPWLPLSRRESGLSSAGELTSATRRQRASTPVVGYNFKVGDFYPSTTIKLYPSIFRSLSDLTRGVRRAS